jgi:hypothetical protein
MSRDMDININTKKSLILSTCLRLSSMEAEYRSRELEDGSNTIIMNRVIKEMGEMAWCKLYLYLS